jgi:hypothetical protein
MTTPASNGVASCPRDDIHAAGKRQPWASRAIRTPDGRNSGRIAAVFRPEFAFPCLETAGTTSLACDAAKSYEIRCLRGPLRFRRSDGIPMPQNGCFQGGRCRKTGGSGEGHAAKRLSTRRAMPQNGYLDPTPCRDPEHAVFGLPGIRVARGGWPDGLAL